jgi:hypothetical protein
VKSYYCPYGGTEQMLASGRSLAQGEYFELTADEERDPHNKRLIIEGHILSAPPESKRNEKDGDDK